MFVNKLFSIELIGTYSLIVYQYIYKMEVYSNHNMKKKF